MNGQDFFDLSQFNERFLDTCDIKQLPDDQYIVIVHHAPDHEMLAKVFQNGQNGEVYYPRSESYVMSYNGFDRYETVVDGTYYYSYVTKPHEPKETLFPPIDFTSDIRPAWTEQYDGCDHLYTSEDD